MPTREGMSLRAALSAYTHRQQRRSAPSPAQLANRKLFGETWGKTGTQIGEMIRRMDAV